MNAAACYPSYTSGNPPARVRIPLLMAAAIVIGVVVTAIEGAQIISHAVAKHGTDAVIARQCLNGQQTTVQFINPATKRKGTVCQLGELFGVVIRNERGDEVTAFLKNKMDRWEQVIRYMRNAGYEIIH